MIAIRGSCCYWSDCFLVRIMIAVSVSVALPPAMAESANTPADTSEFCGALIKAADATPARMNELKSSGKNSVVFMLNSSNDEAKEVVRKATRNAVRAGLAFAYWVEVARSPKLADEHPEWMASLQTHEEWRRFFPNALRPQANEVVKTYPWVPVLSRAPFKAQQERVLKSLANLPTPQLIFLNDLQGAPSACGCGNPLCRWTSDYGKRRTTIPLWDDAAARFIERIEKAWPNSEVIPVWTTECEEHDGHPDGLCAGVGCFQGICWKAYTRQLMPVADRTERLAVLALYKEFQRDISYYGAAEASWVEFAIRTFQTMPPRHNGTAIAAARMIAVVQGWDVTAQEIEAQLKAARNAGANGWVVAYDKIDQSWTPKVVAWK